MFRLEKLCVLFPNHVVKSSWSWSGVLELLGRVQLLLSAGNQ